MMITGCLMLGLGLGMLVGNTGAGVMIGLGVGFILEYVTGRSGGYRWGSKGSRHDKPRE